MNIEQRVVKEVDSVKTKDEIEHDPDIREIEFWLKTHTKEQRDRLFELLRNPSLPDMPAIRAALEKRECGKHMSKDFVRPYRAERYIPVIRVGWLGVEPETYWQGK